MKKTDICRTPAPFPYPIRDCSSNRRKRDGQVQATRSMLCTARDFPFPPSSRVHPDDPGQAHNLQNRYTFAILLLTHPCACRAFAVRSAHGLTILAGTLEAQSGCDDPPLSGEKRMQKASFLLRFDIAAPALHRPGEKVCILMPFCISRNMHWHAIDIQRCHSSRAAAYMNMQCHAENKRGPRSTGWCERCLKDHNWGGTCFLRGRAGREQELGRNEPEHNRKRAGKCAQSHGCPGYTRSPRREAIARIAFDPASA